MDELGYTTDLEDASPFPIDEFIAKTTQWLQKSIDKPSPEEEPQQDGNIISGGKPQGYYNQVIKQMNHIARVGKQNGATHVPSAKFITDKFDKDTALFRAKLSGAAYYTQSYPTLFT